MKDKIKEEEINMEIIKVSVQDVISKMKFQKVNLSSYLDDKKDTLIIKLAQRIAALPEKEFIIYRSWPKTWWDAFKERWFPPWARIKWPVEYERIDIEQKIYKAICPHLGTHPTEDHLKWILRRKREIE